MTIKRFSVKRHQQTKQKIMLVLSVLFFLSMTGFNMISLFNQAFKSSSPVTSEASTTDPLQEEARGYEQVLQREPNNQAALEGLVNTRLEMNDAAGAIAGLEKLIELYPERTDYMVLRDQIKLQAADQP